MLILGIIGAVLGLGLLAAAVVAAAWFLTTSRGS